MQGILEHLLKQHHITAYVESCGLHSSFLGASPNERMQEVAQTHGISLENRAKLFEDSYFDQFDWIFCVTKEILESVKHMAHQKEFLSKLYLATHFSKKYLNQDIPDPYFGGSHDFAGVWTMMEEACQGIFEALFVDN